MSEVSTSLDPQGTSFARPFARKTRASLSLSRFDLPRRPGYVSPLFLPRTRPWSLFRFGSDETTSAKVAIGDRRGRDAEGEGIEIPSGPRAREGGAGTPPRLSRPLSFSRSLPLCGDRSSLSRATKGSGVAPPVLAPSPPSESVPSLRLRMRSSLSLQPLRIRAGPGARPEGSRSEEGDLQKNIENCDRRKEGKEIKSLTSFFLAVRAGPTAPANVVSAPISAKMGGGGDRDSREAERGRRPQPRKKKTREKRERGSVCGGRGW